MPHVPTVHWLMRSGLKTSEIDELWRKSRRKDDILEVVKGYEPEEQEWNGHVAKRYLKAGHMYFPWLY